MITTGGRPLARFSVLDLTTVRSGPTGTKLLADFGADVLRVKALATRVEVVVENYRPTGATLLAGGVVEPYKGETT